MLDFNERRKVFITCKDRSVTYLEKEVRELGFVPESVQRTGIELIASMEDCMDLNLHLRTASHVLFEIKSFYLRHADDIYRRVKAITWEDYLDVDGYFSINSVADNESVTTPLIVNVKIKDAIVDRFRDLEGDLILVQNLAGPFFRCSGRIRKPPYTLIPLETRWPSMDIEKFQAKLL